MGSTTKPSLDVPSGDLLSSHWPPLPAREIGESGLLTRPIAKVLFLRKKERRDIGWTTSHLFQFCFYFFLEWEMGCQGKSLGLVPAPTPPPRQRMVELGFEPGLSDPGTWVHYCDLILP